jgi:hypothetical protein
LMTPSINLTGHSELHFWHMMDGEISGTYTDSAYDAGILEISANGGAWAQMTPAVNGYNKWIRCMAGGSRRYNGPFAGRTPCFGGTIAWTEVVCDLAAYSGPVRFRFRFGSDSSTAREGWYVDDIKILLVAGSNAPSQLQAQLIGSAAHLTWHSPTSAAMATLLGYNIYRDNVKIDSLVRAVSYDDPLAGLPYGTYTYSVSATYSTGETGRSNTAAVVWNAAPPDAPVHVTVVISGNDIILRWDAVSGATAYNVYASANPISFVDAPVAAVSQNQCTLVGEAANYDARFYLVKSVRN